MVLYALVSDTSIGYLFLGGVFPGLLIGAAQMVIAAVAKRRNFPVEPTRAAARDAAHHLGGVPALMMPVVLLGCIYSGVTTPTEAAAVAAAYALLISVVALPQRQPERRLRLAGVQRAHHGLDRHADRRRDGLQLRRHGREHPADAERAPEGARLSPIVFLILVNVMLLMLGCLLEGTTILLVILPVLIPTAQALGIDLVHFGVVCVVNIMLGWSRRPTGCCSSS